MELVYVPRVGVLVKKSAVPALRKFMLKVLGEGACVEGVPLVDERYVIAAFDETNASPMKFLNQEIYKLIVASDA